LPFEDLGLEVIYYVKMAMSDGHDIFDAPKHRCLALEIVGHRKRVLITTFAGQTTEEYSNRNNPEDKVSTPLEYIPLGKGHSAPGTPFINTNPPEILRWISFGYRFVLRYDTNLNIDKKPWQTPGAAGKGAETRAWIVKYLKKLHATWGASNSSEDEKLKPGGIKSSKYDKFFYYKSHG
jgi:hypothetical protein